MATTVAAGAADSHPNPRKEHDARLARVGEERVVRGGDGSGADERPAKPIGALARGHSLSGLATTRREGRPEELISRDFSVARGLLDRDELLKMLDQAVTKRVTVISAPPGSGKTSLLRVWADRSTSLSRVAFVSVDRDEQDAQRFWSAVLARIVQ